ncbi:putative uncharacterized protein DDB_G0282133 isoform X2 [Rhopalosiphum padi]|uniref:putative uncharacterized protein DDB_G0282133 isoform X2 n=1 Tax=Rhopalosiphum padi TaxID=40932 RepID=UPI00298E7719|nr:putative uncharacterized protein DDB_G0282133 isoform X2 [Rhopalosiphum padi]
MKLDMALGSAAPTSFQHRCGVTTALILIVCVALTKSAPTTYDEIEAKRTDLADYFNDPNGCYYNYQHYEEGDRIVTNEPCLNCTCHNRMLMCYLRVCPFSKAIGQDCTVQKSPDQCCPVISCPEVPVHLLTSSTTPTPTTTTEIGWHDNYGCMMDENEFFPDGAQVPPNPKKPCELCYCIRNRTACIMQECTLHVEGCRPVYHEGVCCPVRYDCDYESEKSTTSAPQITGGLVFSTTSAPFDCRVNDDVYRDGESIAMVSEKPCEHCYCMRGDIVCAVQDCGEPLRGKDCTPETPPAGQCCPTSYQCANETNNSYDITTLQPVLLSDSDENEAEKFPINEDIYNKLGETQPTSEHDEGNEVESDHAMTIPPNNHNTAGETNILPENDSTNNYNEANKEGISSTLPNLTDQENIGTESGQANYDSTNKPNEATLVDEVQPTQLPASDPSTNENAISSSTQTIPNEGDNVKVDEENNSNEIPDKDPINGDLTSNSPVSSTDNIVEGSTQASNFQDNPQDDITTENQPITDIPKVENEPTEQNKPVVDSTSETENQPESIQTPVEQNNQDSPQPENVSATEIPNVQNEPIVDGTSETENQPESDTPQVEQNNQDNPQSENAPVTTIPNVLNEPTEQNKPIVDNASGTGNQPESDKTPVEQNNQDSPPSENVSVTEIPNEQNEPTEQNKPIVDNASGTGNQPESDKTPVEQNNQDNPQSENVLVTEIPNVQNEPTEQNKPIVDNASGTGNQPESDKTPVEQNNQDSPQSENVSVTEIPNVQNEPVVDGTSETENQPESDTTQVEQSNQDNPQSENVPVTTIPNVLNEPTEQNKPIVDNASGTGNQPESDKTPVEQNNQDSPQSENVSVTEIPNEQNEPTEQNKPIVDNASGTGNQPESDKTPVEQNNQDNPQSENVPVTEIPNSQNEPTEQSNQDSPQSENVATTEIPNVQNEPIVDNASETGNQPESDNTPVKQNNQDSPQPENVATTEIPNVQNEPIVDNASETGNQPESDNTPVKQNNQDSPQSENVPVTEIPNVQNEPTEQNNPIVSGISVTDNRPESDKTPAEQSNQVSPQSENVSVTEIPNVQNEPTEQNKPVVDNASGTGNQPESDKTPVEQNNQDNPQSENLPVTEIPNVQNEPTEQNKPVVHSSLETGNQPESDNTPVEQNNQDNPQSENVPVTEIPNVQNEPTEQNNPIVSGISVTDNRPESDKTPAEQSNQVSPQSENVFVTEIPNVQNEPTEQNKPIVDNASGTGNQPESDKTPVEQNNQDSPQSENVSVTEIPNVQNEPVVDGTSETENQPESDTTQVEQNNQDNPQSENVPVTTIPNVLNEPTEQNKPIVDNASGTGNQPESNKTPVEQNNQDSPQSENVSVTEIPNEQNEPTEQNKPIVDNASGTGNQPESDKTPVEQNNQDNPQSENVSVTEIPNVQNEPTEQNKPLVDNASGTVNQPESDKTPVEQNNQDSPQSENVSVTEIPNVQNEPTEQNKPVVVSTYGTGNQPDSDKTPAIQNNQDSPQSENKVTENNPIQPVVSENDASTEQPNEENNIFVVSPTSPPLFSDNQVKGDESVSIINENNTSDMTVNSKPSNDDKGSLLENTDAPNILSENHTDVVTESLNVVPQPNAGNIESSLNIKPINNKDNSADVTDSPVTSQEQLPAIAEHNDNRLGSNNPVNLEPVLTPTTEINHDVNTEVINHGVLIDDSPSQANQPIDVHSGEEDESAPNADSVDQQITHQTETPEELTNKYPLSVDEHTNDVTTSLPQQQIVENNIPAVHPQVINPSEITTQDETKTQNDVSANGSLEQSSGNDVPTATVEVQNSEDVSKPTESPVLHSNNGEAPEQNNEYESITPQEQSQDENVNEIVDQTSVYPDTSSDEKNNLVTSTGLSLNNVDNVTPSSDKIETDFNSQVSDEKPNQDVSVESATIQAISGNIDNNADNVVTTNSYADLPSTNAPGNQMVKNEVNSPVNPTNTVETNVNNDRPENVVPQLSSNEASTQYSEDDSSTNSPIQESPNVNIINDVEASTNTPNEPESPNDINQDSNAESELYTTQSPNAMQILNAFPIVDGKPSESPQNADKPLVSKTPDYVIDITTSVYSESSNAPELNEPVDSVSEVATLNENKNTDVVTEMYENAQPGVPGEGSCLIDFVTYAHKAEVPKSNPCHEKCECLNSIVTCTSVNCPPAPPQHRNCIPLHPGNESWCCPTYMCEGGIEGMLFDSHNQLGSPQLISTVVLEDKPSEVNDEKPQTDEEISSTNSPQISQEYNTVTPSQFDLSSNINSEDSIGVTEVPAHTETPNRPIEDHVTTDDESQPIENDQHTENNKPTKIDQPFENPKPIENTEADSTTTSYVTDDQSITNKPETLNNNEEQNVLYNTVNESQDYLAPSTQVPESYEPAVTSVLPTSDQNRPEQNSEPDVSISITTYKPNDDSIVNQQQVDSDNKASEETNNPPVNEDSNTNPIDIVTDLPASEINPLEVGTQTPTVIADEKPMVSGNNVDGLRPSSIDDIISSIYLVKDSVKNSLETSSKPTETSNEEIGLFENDYQTTPPEDFPSEQYNNNESQTTVSSINSTPESQKTDVINEISSESPSATTEANISQPSENAADGLAGVTQIPNISPQFEVNSVEQGVSTDLPSNSPEVEATVDDSKSPVESPTTQSMPNSGEQDLANNNGPETPSNPILTQVQNAGEPNAESPASEVTVVVDDNKTPEISAPLSEQHEVPVDDTAVVVNPAAEEKPDNVNSPIITNSDVPAEVVTQTVVTGRPVVSTPDDSDKRFGEQNSSSFRPPFQGGDDNNHENEHPRPETADAVHIPLDTETPAFNPSTNAPLATYSHKPSYTPIPQSTWTQKPFHQDSTSEAPLQPDQGFPDEYDDENEAVYGPGTCRYGGKVYVSAQQVPRDDPCDFCFCFRGDIICLQQSCPPPIFGCYQENIQGFCCPRYECPVAQATSVNVTTTTTSTTTMVPPHFFANAYRGAARRTGCLIHGHAYRVGEDVGIASGPCLECICGADGKMKCDPKPCSPEPLLRKMMAEAVEQKRR